MVQLHFRHSAMNYSIPLVPACLKPFQLKYSARAIEAILNAMHVNESFGCMLFVLLLTLQLSKAM